MNNKLKLNISICPVSLNLNSHLKRIIKKKYKFAKFNTSNVRLSDEYLLKFLSDSSIAIIGIEKLDKDLINQLPKLKAVVKYGVGYDNIDIKHLKNRKILFKVTKGVNKISVAELTLTLALMAIKKINENLSFLKKGLWKREIGNNLEDKTIGIIGLGNIGKESARIFKRLNCKVLAYDIIDKKKYCIRNGLNFVSLNKLLKDSDIISFHVPLNSSTKYFINHNFFKKIKKNRIIINTSRGMLCKLNGLYKILKKNENTIYATDVFEKEPEIPKKLIKLKNFISTPHIGGSTYESIISMGIASIKNLDLVVKKINYVSSN
jgi:D-3-phosphoglycerate dehydrogenase